MNKSIDIFAATNPAFCSLVILGFCKGYFEESNEAVPFPLLIFPIPFLLSGDLSHTFSHTSMQTGFFRWVENNPEIRINLSQRIEESCEYTNPAIRYGFNRGVLTLTDDGLITPNVKKGFGNTTVDLYFKKSERLGRWFGQIKSTKTIYNHLGIQV